MGLSHSWPRGSIGEGAQDPFKPLQVPKKGTEEYNTTVDQMAGRIVKTYLAANPEEHHLGETFYSQEAHGAAKALANDIDPDSHFGRFLRSVPHSNPRTHSAAPPNPVQAEGHERMRQAAGTIARLSPQTGWEMNVTQAWEAHNIDPGTLHRLQTDERDTTRKPLADGQYPRTEIRDDAGNKLLLNRQPTKSVLRAVDIDRGQRDPDEMLRQTGRVSPRTGKPLADKDVRVKIGSFYSNILDPHNSPHTTVDFRAHDIAAGKLLDTNTDRGLASKGRYEMFEEAHTRAADIINTWHADRRLQSEPVQPKQVQAVTWWADKHDVDRRLGGVVGGGHLHAGQDGGALHRSDLGRPVGQ